MVIKVAAARTITRTINSFGFGSIITVDYTVSQEATLILEEMEVKPSSAHQAPAAKRSTKPLPAAIYRPRNPQLSDYYRCVEDYFETFVGIYYEHFSHQYGFWRPYVEQVIYRYLDCGDLYSGFARVKC
jgi:hypothetical protein